MNRITRPTLALCVVLGCSALLALPSWQVWQQQRPNFAIYPAGDLRKAAFFAYLGPIVDEENLLRQRQRERLQALRSESVWDAADRSWLAELADFYDLDDGLTDAALVDQLLMHVDTVPRSLALAQAAKESAWGTSRFAVDGNNYFGQRCYQKGCGMVPRNRPRGAKYEVRRYDSVQASVSSYMNNINSHREYQGLRKYRAEQRRKGEPVKGIQAAERLTQYSERRQAYVDEVQSLIHFNKLEQAL